MRPEREHVAATWLTFHVVLGMWDGNSIMTELLKRL